MYYISVDINKGSEFSIQTSYERDPIELKENIENDLTISPWSSTYGEIKLPKQTERNTVINIEITGTIEKPYDDDKTAGVAALISVGDPYINPANAVWTKYKPMGQTINVYYFIDLLFFLILIFLIFIFIIIFYFIV